MRFERCSVTGLVAPSVPVSIFRWMVLTTSSRLPSSRHGRTPCWAAPTWPWRRASLGPGAGATSGDTGSRQCLHRTGSSGQERGRSWGHQRKERDLHGHARTAPVNGTKDPHLDRQLRPHGLRHGRPLVVYPHDSGTSNSPGPTVWTSFQ